MTTATREDDGLAVRMFIGCCSLLSGALRWAVSVLPLVTATFIGLWAIGEIGKKGFWGMAAGLAILALLIFIWSKAWRWQLRHVQADRFRSRLRKALVRMDTEPRWVRVERTAPGAYSVRIRVASGHSVEQLRAVMPTVADDLAWVSWVEEPGDVRAGVADFSITQRDPFAATIPAPPLPAQGSIADPVDVAVGTSGQCLQASLLYQHVLVGGTTGGGKSQLLLRLIDVTVAAEDAQTWLIDPARVEFSRLASRADRTALDAGAAAELLDELVAEMNRRLELMEDRGTTKWKPTADDPAIVLFVDELASLTVDVTEKNLKQRIMAALATLARIARKTAITLVLATQTPDISVIPSQLRNNMQTRACFRVMSWEQGKTILGEYAAGLDFAALHPTRPGMLYLAGNQYTRPALGRAYLAHEDEDNTDNKE